MRLLPGCQKVRHRLTEASLAGPVTPRAGATSRRNDMTTTVSRERPHSTEEMLAVHRVFRRESALMPRLGQAVPDGNTGQAALIGQAFRDYQLGLHIHHTGEDT